MANQAWFRRSLFVVFLLVGIYSNTYAQTGTISGVIIDQENGETLIGANVLIEGTMTGSTTDIDGRFQIPGLDVGSYTVIVSYIGYNSMTIQDVEVLDGETTVLELTMAPEAIGLEEVVVEARAIRNSEGLLLRDRQKAPALSDAISAETISRSGSSTASDAMKKVTGASVVGGKYVYVRGLGDRYMNSQLNGANLPSSDPERNAVPLDLFPAGLLDNIVTTKTFTPDQPGSFTGGSVNVSTKDYPDQLTVSLSSSVSFNSNVGLGDDILLYGGGSAGRFGGNGNEIPVLLVDPAVEIPSISFAFTDDVLASELDEFSTAFSDIMSPTIQSVPVSQSYSISLGNQFMLFNRPLGAVASISYGRSIFGYDNGTTGRYQLTGAVAATETLNEDFRFVDQLGRDEVLWGGLANLSYKPHPKHKIGVNAMLNQGAESSGRYQSGTFPRDLRPEEVYETRVLQYIDRTLTSYQLRGDHAFGANDTKLEWNASISESEQDEPDLRFFTNNFTISDRNNVVDTLYSIQTSIYPEPTRYFRNLKEDNWEVNGSLTIPFNQWDGLSAKAKVGGSFQSKERVFRERRFEIRRDDIDYDGAEDFFSQENAGILEENSTEFFTRFGNYVQDATQRSANYDGDQEVAAFFGMIDIPLSKRLRVITGARLETTDIFVASQDSSLQEGILDNSDLLPSFNFVYALQENMNLRAAFGKTLARPTFREIAPFASFEFVGDFVYLGNAELKRTLVSNYDLRWEWFSRPGEIYAVSAFYKDFSNPIERTINPVASNPEIKFENVEEATVYGVELEFRKRLDQISTALQNLQFGVNLSLVHSEVALDSLELAQIREGFDPNASSTRSLQGQSPYMLNINLTYDNQEIGTTVSAFYNVFGERLDQVSLGGTPDIFEQPQHIVDLTLSQKVGDSGFVIKGSIKNLLDERFELSHTYNGIDYITNGYDLGRSYSLGFSYTLTR